MKSKILNYCDLAEMISARIERNEYLPGELLPTERDFITRYNVSRQTARRAIELLKEEGYVRSVQGQGTFVEKINHSKVAFGVINESDNASFTSLVRKFGIEISSKLLATGIIDSNRFFSSKLEINTDELIFGMHRIRYGNREALAIEYTYLPLKFFEDIGKHNFEHVSLYDYMATKEHLPLNFREKFIMTQANPKIAKYLGLTDDLTVNKMEITGFDSENNIVEFTESYSRPDKLEVRFVTK